MEFFFSTWPVNSDVHNFSVCSRGHPCPSCSHNMILILPFHSYVTYNSLTKDPKKSCQEKSFWPNQKLVHAFFLLEESNVHKSITNFSLFIIIRPIFHFLEYLWNPKTYHFVSTMLGKLKQVYFYNLMNIWFFFLRKVEEQTVQLFNIYPQEIPSEWIYDYLI